MYRFYVQYQFLRLAFMIVYDILASLGLNETIQDEIYSKDYIIKCFANDSLHFYMISLLLVLVPHILYDYLNQRN
jgi:hypothetical protein